MNGKVAKMIRRLQKDTHKGKREFLAFNHIERREVRADYIKRGQEIRESYSIAKRIVKREQISNS